MGTMNKIQRAIKRNDRVRVISGHVLAPCDGVWINNQRHGHVTISRVLTDSGHIIWVEFPKDTITITGEADNG